MPFYLHQTQGRIRIRSDYIRHNPYLVKRVVQQLETQQGIQQVHHRYHAGSVAICFDHMQVDPELLLSQLRQYGWLDSLSVPPKVKRFEGILHDSAKMVVKGVLLNQLKRSWQGAILAGVLTQWMNSQHNA